ncbi:hypothetical protein [Actinoplanes sp. NBRC 103695]|uniref:hypothetical protein n=1 Tax=Actinoplanes sp. NBRC 103695 TaxID=3032202 RepID=UPI0024A21FFB|nr:hypothetical protein [Actinoplanes sp. NBRC 103695]GLZ00248.1 hypothetical protein Acsp02_75000 [Actinoplanes sp. NBRC 103695]
MSDNREPIGDPDDDGGDFAEEHEQTEVTPSDEGEPESPDRYSGGLDDDGPV